MATKFKHYGLFALHFKIMDYYQSLSHRLPLHKMVLKGLKSYKKKETYILSPVRSHGKNSEPKDNINPNERKASPEA